MYPKFLAKKEVLKDRKKRLLSEITDISNDIISTEDKLEVSKDAKEQLTKMSIEAREKALNVIESITKNMIGSTISDRYGFEVQMKTNAGKPFASFYITEMINGEKNMQDLILDSGGATN